jgi:hypothetical protein
METEINSDWIDRYNENELSETERLIFQERMFANPLLRSEVSIDAQLNRFLADEDLLDLMSKMRSASLKRTKGFRHMNALLIAASVICIIMIGGLFYLVRTSITPYSISDMKENDKVNGARMDGRIRPAYAYEFEQPVHDISFPGIAAINHRFIAKNFAPLPEFDLLIGSVTRSHLFKLISPGVNDSVSPGTAVQFAWQEYDQTEPISIIMMNNRGDPVFETSLKEVSLFMLETDSYPDGLYYWKIMMDEGIVLMGKLTIIK